MNTTATPSANPEHQDSRTHYEALISYFKWLVTVSLSAIGLVAAVGLSFFHRDIAQFRSEARASIEATKDSVAHEIDTIRQDAAKIALMEAQKRVEEAFKTANVSSMVESTARRQVGPVIEHQVREEVDRVMGTLRKEMTNLGEVADLGAKMRIGLRSGLEGLAVKVKTAPNENERMRAKAFLDSIAADYETVELVNIREHGAQRALDDLGSWNMADLSKDRNPVPGLVRIIRTGRELNRVAFAFLALREAANYPFKMFDIEAVDGWCEAHKAVCS